MRRGRPRQRKCRCCKDLFRPHPAVRERQNFCSSSDCQKARKAANNRAFKQRNPDYHKGPAAVERVRQWRRENPGYWRRSDKRAAADSTASAALQAEHVAQSAESEEFTAHLAMNALQAELQAQRFVIHGLTAHLTGCALQAELSSVLGQWHDKGMAMGAAAPGYQAPGHDPNQGGHDAPELCTAAGSDPAHPKTLQLDRPPAGP
jgi:hypothetical protein